MQRILPFILGVAITTTAAPALAGGFLATPLMLTSGFTQAVRCVVTNVDSKPAAVEVSIKTNLGHVVPPAQTSCPTPPSTLGAGESCNATGGLNDDGMCTFVGKGKFRAAIHLVDSADGVLAPLPATAK